MGERKVNAHDVLMYGHRTFMESIREFPPEEWEMKGVCGVWSAKDVISHLASYENILIDVLNGLLRETDMPALKEFVEGGQAFNDRLVEMRELKSHDEVLQELNGYHQRVLSLVVQVPPEKLRQAGTIPWYGQEYSVEDYIVYQYYGHKREHAGQIASYLDRRGREQR